MNRRLLLGVMMASAASLHAQDTYLNNQLVNNSDKLFGSARYVGMGGALGALGADISTMGWNPAGIGLMRKGETSLTFGGVWDKEGTSQYGKGSATLDHAGMVFAIDLGSSSSKLQYLNIGFNYQKKANYNNSFTADNNSLNGLSQLDQLAEMTQAGLNTKDNLAGFLYETDMYDVAKDAAGNEYVSNKYYGNLNRFTQHTSGSLSGFDVNFSGNVSNRFYWGLDIGIDALRYRAFNDYYEEKSNEVDALFRDHTLQNDIAIDGWGVNFKFGVIFRPIEESPFRLGLTAETPTWYNLKRSTFYNLSEVVSDMHTQALLPDKSITTPSYESYMEYSIRTPWKLRLSAGSTVSNYLAWGIDYEYANSASTKMGYPYNAISDPHNSLFSNEPDKDMNELTKNNLKAAHTLRLGLEYKPISAVAIRLGYNYATSGYKDHPTFDQFSLNCAARDYATSTHYMTLGDAHALTLGLGYKWKSVYLDLAYKARTQKADFYAFDTSFTAANRSFAKDNPEHAGLSIDPVKVDQTKHQLTATLGFKF
ncbi:MAG: hypothetical protein KBT12_08670 [Bacteroidales bacterium]|nr:hypothetical protein [Candidatus Physcousia equi]